MGGTSLVLNRQLESFPGVLKKQSRVGGRVVEFCDWTQPFGELLLHLKSALDAAVAELQITAGCPCVGVLLVEVSKVVRWT